MKKSLKYKLSLGFALSLLVSQLILIMVYPSSAVAWSNGPYSRYAVTFGGYSNSEGGPHYYAFTEKPMNSPKKGFYNYYGAHDWIADSALKLLAENPSFKDEIKWLFTFENYDTTI